MQLVQKRQEVDQEQKRLKSVPSTFILFPWASSTRPYMVMKLTAGMFSLTRQPAETTVNDHIRLLRQYNKTKDVGQQLIGLIAENRGVPVGSLYADQDYGIGADD